MEQLQPVLNAASRVLLRAPRFDRDLLIKIKGQISVAAFARTSNVQVVHTCLQVVAFFGSGYLADASLLPGTPTIEISGQQIKTRYRSQCINYQHLGRDYAGFQFHPLGIRAQSTKGMTNYLLNSF